MTKYIVKRLSSGSNIIVYFYINNSATFRQGRPYLGHQLKIRDSQPIPRCIGHIGKIQQKLTVTVKS